MVGKEGFIELQKLLSEIQLAKEAHDSAYIIEKYKKFKKRYKEITGKNFEENLSPDQITSIEQYIDMQKKEESNGDKTLTVRN